MKVFIDEKMVKRNKTIGNVLSISSIAILGIGMFMSFKDKDGSYLPYTFGSLIVGFLLFQVANFYMNKWGKSPRPDEKLSLALKGLDSNYSLFHYKSLVSHLLVGPAGIFALLPYSQTGEIEYTAERNHWKQKGGNFFLKTFGGDSLGRPDLDARYASTDLVKQMSKLNVDLGKYTPQPIIVFINPKVLVKAEGSQIPAVTLDKLKEFIRKQVKLNNISPDIITAINKELG